MNKDYYNINGLSPLDAMRKGLISKDEYRGFLMGNIIKYVSRYQYKDDPIGDLEKCKDYLCKLIEWEQSGDNL